MANEVNIINCISSDGGKIGGTSAFAGVLPFVFHFRAPASSASLAPLVPSWMDRRLLLLLPFIIGTPSSLALTLRTTLDCAVYLTIYKNIRWRLANYVGCRRVDFVAQTATFCFVSATCRRHVSVMSAT